MPNIALIKSGVVQNVIVSTLAFAQALPGYDSVVDATGMPTGPGYSWNGTVFTAPIPTKAPVLGAIAVGASLFSWQNTFQVPVTISIAGGAVTGIAISNNGTVWTNTGLTAGVVSLHQNDWVRVGYSVTPTMTLIP